MAISTKYVSDVVNFPEFFSAFSKTSKILQRFDSDESLNVSKQEPKKSFQSEKLTQKQFKLLKVLCQTRKHIHQTQFEPFY